MAHLAGIKALNVACCGEVKADKFDLIERLRSVANGEATQQVVRSRVNEAVEEISRLRAEITAAKALLKQLMAVFERSA